MRVHGAERFLFRFRRHYSDVEYVIDIYGPGGYYGDLGSSADLGRPVLCGLADSSGATTIVSSEGGRFETKRATETPPLGRTTMAARLSIDADRPTLMAATGLSRDNFLLAEGFESGFSVWEVVANSGVRLASRLLRGVKTLDWLDLPDHRKLLAIGCDDGSLTLMGLEPASDAPVGAPGRWRTENFDSPYDHPGIISVTWCLPSSRLPMTAVLCEDLTVRREPGPFAAVPHEASGNKLSSGPDTPPPPDVTPPSDAPPPPDAPPRPTALHVDPAGLVALGKADLWPPLSLVEDLVALTGRTAPGALHDPRFRALADHPGIVRLKELAWPGRSRIGFAGLLAAETAQVAECAPPPGSGDADRVAALRDALASGLCESDVPAVPLTPVADVANRVSDRMISLLTVLGPETVQADPSLPLLLARSAADMPHLDRRQLRLLAPQASDGSARTKTTVHAPGTSGTSNRGALTHLLPTQLALPRTLLLLKHSRHELLYRLHVTEAEPFPGEVTLVLDTSPPTFGPVEALLRAAAHLITAEFWRYGRHPQLVTFDRPSQAVPVARPTDLLALWTTRTLDVPDVARALATAATSGAPALLLTHHRLPRELGLTPGPQLRLFTTHSADDAPAGRWALPFQRHVPPSPQPAQLRNAISALLMG
uniref:Uncharacterized protein n=1 Tax=Streptomyces spiramyceticus TaxID=299717 RepID=A0A411PXG0_9ACTN|nr:hypothetical protein [Streptomyces spiramyceticus]